MGFNSVFKGLSSSLYSFLHTPITSSLLSPNILLNTLFSNALSLHSSLNVSDQVSYPYKTTGKIIFLSFHMHCVIVQIKFCILFLLYLGPLLSALSLARVILAGMNIERCWMICISNWISVQRTCATNGSVGHLGRAAKQLFLWCCLRQGRYGRFDVCHHKVRAVVRI